MNFPELAERIKDLSKRHGSTVRLSVSYSTGSYRAYVRDDKGIIASARHADLESAVIAVFEFTLSRCERIGA